MLRLIVRLAATALALSASAASGADAASDACTPKTFEGQAYTVCAADLAHHDIRLHLKRTDGTSYSRPDAVPAKDLMFAVNAGMFTPAYAPAGLYVENGQQATALNTRNGGGNFHLSPNGVFWIKDGRAFVTPTAEFAKADPKPQWATQSGPMLVIDGQLHPKFDANGPSRYVRNGVGVSTDGKVYFAISEEPVSFGAFARLFRDALQCPNALYLDGAVSQLFIPGANRFVGGVTLGPLFAVYAKKP
jgi:uncharacterized protein YigE (DUF2233 family)